MTGPEVATDHDRARRRAYAVPAISRLTRSPEFRATYPGNRHTLIAVLPDDTVAYVLDRIRLADSQPILALVMPDGVQLATVRFGLGRIERDELDPEPTP